MILAIDFDGTICENNFPKIGKEIPYSIQVLKLLKKEGHKLILWTCRNEQYLDNAVKYCANKGLIFDAVNNNIPENENLGFAYPKILYDILIDDRALFFKPDWKLIYKLITKLNI